MIHNGERRDEFIAIDEHIEQPEYIPIMSVVVVADELIHEHLEFEINNEWHGRVSLNGNIVTFDPAFVQRCNAERVLDNISYLVVKFPGFFAPRNLQEFEGLIITVSAVTRVRNGNDFGGNEIKRLFTSRVTINNDIITVRI